MFRIPLAFAFVTMSVHAQSRKAAPTPAGPPAPVAREVRPGEHLFYQAPPNTPPVPEPPPGDGQWPAGLQTLPIEYIRTHRVYLERGQRQVYVRVACHEGDFAIRGACSQAYGRSDGGNNSHTDPSLPLVYGTFKGSRGWICEYDTSGIAPDADETAAGIAEAIAICVKRKDFMNYQFPARGRGDDF